MLSAAFLLPCCWVLRALLLLPFFSLPRVWGGGVEGGGMGGGGVAEECGGVGVQEDREAESE